MVQNRNKILDLLIGNLSNVVIHKILEKAIDNEEIFNKYHKEIKISLEIAKKYREKINPINKGLSEKDLDYVKKRLMNKVKSELLMRISKGYKNIDLNLIELVIEEVFNEIKMV